MSFLDFGAHVVLLLLCKQWRLFMLNAVLSAAICLLYKPPQDKLVLRNRSVQHFAGPKLATSYRFSTDACSEVLSGAASFLGIKFSFHECTVIMFMLKL